MFASFGPIYLVRLFYIWFHQCYLIGNDVVMVTQSSAIINIQTPENGINLITDRILQFGNFLIRRSEWFTCDTKMFRVL